MPRSERHDTPVARNPGGLAERFIATRALTEALAAPLSDADASIQSMEDASPAKWHLAHTTWFWETFLLRDHAPGYRLPNPDWPLLFNSYYEAEGARIARGARGMLSRPTLADILEWRAGVTEAMAPLLADPALAALIALGAAHEQQHIELLLTDIKHALFQNPLGVAMWDGKPPVAAASTAPMGWYQHPGGIALIGHQEKGFAFDNEGPRHRVLLEPFALADRLVTNAEWDEFITAGSYRDPRLWLADGWAWVQREGGGGPAQARLLPRIDHRQHDRAHRDRSAAIDARDAGDRRAAADRHGSGQGRGRAARRL